MKLDQVTEERQEFCGELFFKSWFFFLESGVELLSFTHDNERNKKTSKGKGNVYEHGEILQRERIQRNMGWRNDYE